MKVSVVSRNKRIVKTVSELLSQSGAEVFVFESDFSQEITEKCPDSDVLIIDIEAAGECILGFIHQFVKKNGIKVIAVSLYAESHIVYAAVKNGVMGYLLKSEADEVVPAVQVVYEDSYYFSSSISSMLLAESSSSFYSAGLSYSEKIFLAYASGRKNRKEIARRFGISVKRVSEILKSIQKKIL